MIDTTTIEMLSGLAERLHKAGVFGAEVTSSDKAFAVLLKGHELGFTPMASASSIAIIKGKVSLSADATIALCKRSPACLFLRLVASTEDVAAYETQRAGDPSPTVMSYTIAQAKTAGLTGSQTWRGHAHAMLRARCGAAIARAVYPDLVAGIYDPDEVAEIVRAEPVRAEVPDVSLAALESWRVTLADVASLRDMHAAWALAAPSLHATGRADHGRTLASERLTALGYALTIAEVQSVLSGAIDPPLAPALDALSEIDRHADDEDGDGVVADAVRVLRGIATAAVHSKVTAFRAAIKRAGALGLPDDAVRVFATECGMDDVEWADEPRDGGGAVIPTLRPEPPDECEAYPRCGLDVAGYCPCRPRITARCPPPDPVVALDALSVAADEAMGRYRAARRGADTEARTAHDLREAARMRARKP